MLRGRVPGRCNRADGIAHLYYRRKVHKLPEVRVGVPVGSDRISPGRSGELAERTAIISE